MCTPRQRVERPDTPEMGLLMKDTLGLEILEAAYSLSEDDLTALQRIARKAAELAPHGPVMTCTYDANGLPDPRARFFERATARYVERFDEGTRAMPVALRRMLLMLEPTVMEPRTSYVERFPRRLRDDVRAMTPLAIMATTGDGGGVTIGLGDPGVQRWPVARISQCRALAQHLAAAWRLRSALAKPASEHTAVAELRIDGVAVGLHPDVSGSTAREALRRAVVAREQARSGRRRAESRLWPALVAGQWTLVDAFHAGGTRYIVAYKNPSRSAALRALQPRERIILEHVLAGRSGKWISLELGLSEPTVARIVQSAARRLGLVGTAGLAGARTAAFTAIGEIGSSDELAIARMAPAVAALVVLSRTEQQIVSCLLRGMQVNAIAWERGRSPRTVAHQIDSIYRKLGVSSRRELVARLVAPT